MAIELTEYQWPAKLVKSGQEDNIVVSTGQNVKIETSPDGEEILDVECPEGKSWSVRIIVEITETDA